MSQPTQQNRFVAMEEGPVNFVEAEDLPVLDASDQVTATVVAEKANDHSNKRTNKTPTTAGANASDCVAIDPFVVLHGAGERRISQHHLNSAGVAK